MKKIYLFLLAAFALFGNAKAQVDVDFVEGVSRDGYTVDADNPLITDAWEQMYGETGEINPCADTGEGSEWALLGQSCPDEILNPAEGSGLTKRNSQDFWHSNWHNGDQTAGSHYLQVMLTDDLDPETDIAFVFKRRNASNDHTIEWSVWGTNDFNAAKNDCELLVESIETPFASNTEVLMSTVFKRGDFKYLRFYSEQQQGGSYGSRGYFHMQRFNIFPVIKMEPIDELRQEAEALYTKYSAYQDNFYERTGDMPGDYSEEAVEAFLNALDAFLDLDMDDAEAIKAWNETIVATYDAIAPTKVPFRGLASGYYRIKAGMAYNDGEERYMLGYRDSGKLWGIWATPNLTLPEDNAQALWKVTALTDSTYDVVNMYHDGRYLPVGRNANCEMTADPAAADTLAMAFDAVASDHQMEISYVNIRLNSQAANDYFYVHQGGHSNGAGTSGYLVGWNCTWDNTNNVCGASEWYFEEVPEDEALQIIEDYKPYKEKDEWIAEFKEMQKAAPGMIEIAKDVQKVYDETLPLVSDENPITSPCSDRDEGQHIEYLWDGKTDNFWHSSWHSEYEIEDHHYFQVEVTDPEAYASALFTFTRRNTTSGNQIDKWTVWGTNTDFEEDPEMVQNSDGLEQLAEISTPYHAGQNTESYVSDPFETKGYKYLRFYCAGTRNNDGTESSNSKFMHLAEFQVYPGHVFESETSQYKVMGEIVTNLEALVEKYADLEGDDYQDLEYDEDYLVFKAAYDAFMEKYVDPTALRDAIATNKNAGDKVVVGTDPGFWPDSSTKEALDALIATAQAYDAAGAYTPEKSEELVAAIEAAAKAVDEAPINKVKEGKWYRLRFGTEAEYDLYKWSKSGNAANYEIDNTDEENPDTLGMYNAGNYGKYIAVAKRENVVIEKADGTEATGNLIVPIAKEDVMLDKSIFGIDLEKLTDPDMALWRFVNVGDSAYAIQNKATGLFIHDGVYLSVQPGLFTQHPSGYGQNAFFNKSIEGNDASPLHLAQSQTVLCAWGDNTSAGWTDADGRRGSFFVEEAEDVAADYAFGDFKMSFTPGDIYGRCYPVPVTLKSDNVKLWTVSKVERTPAAEGVKEQVKVTFAQITNPAVPAGRPFFVVANGEMPEEDEDYEPVIAEFSFSFNLINTPQTDSYLKGVFDTKTIAERFLTTGTGHEEKALEWKGKNSTVGDNRVYITDIAEGAEPFSLTAELTVDFDETAPDGIQAAIQNVSRQGAIYSIDGRRVGNGNLNSVSKFGRGVYILNGTKVTVK